MREILSIGGFDVEVTKKDIKNIHLNVHTPTGNVKISAPSKMDIETIKAFTLTKLDWIKRHHQKMIKQARETKREFIQREREKAKLGVELNKIHIQRMKTK